jgi:iron complex transport system ATP-binding protein
MENSLLRIENLTTGYRHRKKDELQLHHTLNLQLFSGELICILGPNGAGKSTLLRTILGFEKAFSGKIYFNEIPSEKLNTREKAKFVSVVLTDKIDDAYLTSYEVVASGRYPYGTFLTKMKKEDKIKIDEAIEMIAITGFSAKHFNQLSDGEKQKVMIARAIAQDTPLVFFDEPIAYVDSPGKVEIMSMVKKLTTAHKKGILLATHDLDSALKYADRLWLIGKNGKSEIDEPKKLVDTGKINEFFDRNNIIFNVENQHFEIKD